MKFAPKHVVTMVACVCAAVVLAPVGVMAATGTLVNLTDPIESSRKARVSGISGLYVDTRPRATAGTFNVFTAKVLDVVGHTVYETGSPNGIALTSAVFTVRGDNTSSVNHVRLFSQVRTSGNAPCGGSGWTMPKTLVTLAVHAGSTEQVVYDGTPLVVPAAPAGQRVCVRFQQTRWVGATELDVAVSGFVFS